MEHHGTEGIANFMRYARRQAPEQGEVLGALRLAFEVLAGGNFATEVGEGLLERGGLVLDLRAQQRGMGAQEGLGVFAACDVLDGEQDELEMIHAPGVQQHRPGAKLLEGMTYFIVIEDRILG
jgi:hypothetical protein